MPLIVFSHANSFPASTYRVLVNSLRERGFTVKAVEKFGHDPAYPVTDNWPHLVLQLADFARREVEKAGAPAFLVGHSLGGYLSLMAAISHPELARGVLLLDAPILGGWRASTMAVMKRAQLVGSVSPGRVSRARRNAWPDREAALAHFGQKKAFARWDPQVLADYVNHGTRDAGGQRVLAFEREVETLIYNTLPDHLERLLRRHPIKCPVAYLGGIQSAEMKQVGMDLTERLVKGRLMMLDGSHLFPMEKPLATAAAIEASLRGIEGR